LLQEVNFSRGDIEKRTEILRRYISRLENRHTITTIETLEKLARALNMPPRKIMCEVDELPKPHKHSTGKARGRLLRIRSRPVFLWYVT